MAPPRVVEALDPLNSGHLKPETRCTPQIGPRSARTLPQRLRSHTLARM
jgi:hypothetical protein